MYGYLTVELPSAKSSNPPLSPHKVPECVLRLAAQRSESSASSVILWRRCRSRLREDNQQFLSQIRLSGNTLQLWHSINDDVLGYFEAADKPMVSVSNEKVDALKALQRSRYLDTSCAFRDTSF